jgi:ubiquinone/menaquinone biosynthesis C-methylase UbiE
LKELLKPNVVVEELEERFYTVMESSTREHEYDDKARFYDAVIGNALYNRILWGNTVHDYQNFCQAALASRSTGYVLDAGCGSLVFTGAVYTQAADRQLILVDRSWGMLKRAQRRLMAENGQLPENITLLQGDLFDLPFREGVFETVQSFGMLHVFGDTQRFIQTLWKMKSASGTLFFNSLVGNNWIGKQYLRLLQRAGEVGVCYTSAALTNELAKMEINVVENTIGNLAYYSC